MKRSLIVRLMCLMVLAAFQLTCATTTQGPPAGIGGSVVQPPPEATFDPEEISQRVSDQTLAALKTMGKQPHDGRVEFVDAVQISSPSAQNPAGLRVLHYKLTNGLQILIQEDHAAPVFAYQTWFSVGSRHERPGITGIAHLFEHLMFKETTNLPEGEFDKIMESHGAQTNAATWLDWTMYRQELPSGNMDVVVRLESDRMENMVLTAAQLESEREVVKNERRYRVDNDPEGTMFEVLYNQAFTHHPYTWPTIGWMKDIEAISLEDCLAFYKKFYAPNNATLVIVGDVDVEKTLTLINAHYGHMKPSKLDQTKPDPEPPQMRERRRVLVMPLTSPKVLVGYRIPGMTDEDHAAIQVLHKILFGGDSGRLYRSLVVESEMASDASGWVSEFAFPGLYEVLVTLKGGGQPEKAEALIDGAMKALAKEPVTEAELDKAKNQLEVQFLRNMLEVGDRAYGLGHYAITGGDHKRLFEATERYRAVTAQDIQRVAARYMKRSNRTVVLAMPAAP